MREGGVIWKNKKIDPGVIRTRDPLRPRHESADAKLWANRSAVPEEKTLTVATDARWAFGPNSPDCRQPLLQHRPEPTRAGILHASDLVG